MTETATACRLDLVQKLILVVIPLGLLHHLDHVGRVDHSSWPFRPEIGPFTFTLLIYPVLVWMIFARHVYTVDPEKMHNLFDAEYPVLGIVANVLTIALTVLLLVAWAVSIRDLRSARAAAEQHDGE